MLTTCVLLLLQRSLRLLLIEATGEISVDAIDREVAATYDITVRATSTDTSSTTKNFTIAIGDVDEFDVSAPSDTDGTDDAVDENAANGTTVGVTASASDADATTNTVTARCMSRDTNNTTAATIRTNGT